MPDTLPEHYGCGRIGDVKSVRKKTQRSDDMGDGFRPVIAFIESIAYAPFYNNNCLTTLECAAANHVRNCALRWIKRQPNLPTCFEEHTQFVEKMCTWLTNAKISATYVDDFNGERMLSPVGFCGPIESRCLEIKKGYEFMRQRLLTVVLLESMKTLRQGV